MLEYRICESFGTEDNSDKRHSYGIALYIDGVCTRRIDDISLERKDIAELVEVFNEEGLDAVHFDYAVEDFLYLM